MHPLATPPKVTVLSDKNATFLRFRSVRLPSRKERTIPLRRFAFAHNFALDFFLADKDNFLVSKRKSLVEPHRALQDLFQERSSGMLQLIIINRNFMRSCGRGTVSATCLETYSPPLSLTDQTRDFKYSFITYAELSQRHRNQSGR